MSRRDHAGDMVEILTGDRSSQVPDTCPRSATFAFMGVPPDAH